MANYFVIGNKFRPYSFDELIKPYQIYGQAYQQQEEAYNNLLNQASDVDVTAFNDAANRETYNNYVNNLKRASESIATNGLSQASRRGVNAARTEYQTNIVPLNKAVEEFNKARDYRERVAANTNGTAVFKNDYLSADSFVNGNKADNTYIDGQKLASDVAKISSTYSKVQRGDATINDLRDLPGYKEYKQDFGWTDEEIEDAIKNEGNGESIVNGIYKNFLDRTGVSSWDSPEKQNIVGSYIAEGLRAGIGTPETKLVQDEEYISPVERERLGLQQQEMKLKQDQFNYETKGLELPDGTFIKSLGSGKSIHYDADGNILSDSTLPETPVIDEKTEEKLATASSNKDVESAGYKPIGALMLHNGKWSMGKEGKNAPGWWTWSRSNLLRNGNYNYSSPVGMTRVTDEEFINFDKPKRDAIEAYLSANDIPDGTPFEIYKVQAKDRRGSAENSFDYVVYVPNNSETAMAGIDKHSVQIKGIRDGDQNGSATIKGGAAGRKTVTVNDFLTSIATSEE